MMGGIGGLGYGGGTMGIGMLLFWGLVVVAVVLLARVISRAGAANGSGEPASAAIEILRARYAKGEIGKREFDEKRRELSSS